MVLLCLMIHILVPSNSIMTIEGHSALVCLPITSMATITIISILKTSAVDMWQSPDKAYTM